VVVHLLNRLTFPINLLASGLNASDADVLQVAGPTDTLTWTWSVPLDVRPLRRSSAHAGHLALSVGCSIHWLLVESCQLVVTSSQCG